MMVKLLEAGEREKFNRDMQWTLKVSPSTRSVLALRMRPYGVSTPYDFFSAARNYVLTDEMIARITTPILITSPENEQFWPGQSQELFGKLSGHPAIVAFTAAEGADSHCDPWPPASAVSGSSTGSTGGSRPDPARPPVSLQPPATECAIRISVRCAGNLGGESAAAEAGWQT